MKHFIYALLLLQFISCNTKSNSDKKTFSPLIEFQYLYLGGNVENGKLIDTYEIKYLSDGLMITGYISKPKDGQSYPALVYNRGGNRNFGAHSERSLTHQRNLAAHGFVVLSTQLRGNMFSQGNDEFGGKDLNDILQLIKIAKSLSFVSPKKIGVYGVSRGGLNTYQISRLTDDIAATVVVGAPVDPRLSHSYRPQMYHKVHLQLIGDTLKHKEKYDYRSPILWASEINEPIFIMHGSADNKVRLDKSAQLMKNEFDKIGKRDFKYKVYDGGNHSLSSHAEERDADAVAWFNEYLR